MGSSRRPAVETPTLSDGREENADLSRSPRLPPRPRLHRPPRKTQFDPGPSPAGQEPEPELPEHEVLHRQPSDRLRCLGSCSWCWHPVHQYFANQVFNPCRNRGGTRNSNNKGANTNNRIFGNSNIDNGILGFLGGF